MATIVTDRVTGRSAVVAQTPTELALLDHGRERGGQLVLLESFYPVVGDRVILPENLSARGARRVRVALEQAADSHLRAQHRRSGFRLVKPEPAAPGPRRTSLNRRDY